MDIEDFLASPARVNPGVFWGEPMGDFSLNGLTPTLISLYNVIEPMFYF
jgi:hypothetical protein